MEAETFTLPGGVPLEMLPVPGVGLVGKFPITQAQWGAMMGVNPSRFKGDDLPVECVSWHDCREVCEKLSALTGREFRLPTAAEWEIALAGQEASLETGWFWGNSGETTHPVGQKEPNAFGLYDMFGNVWEWCEDSEDSWKRLRGGSWFDDLDLARSVYRDINRPAGRDVDFGCRVVCVVRPPSLDTDPRVAREVSELLTQARAEVAPGSAAEAAITLLLLHVNDLHRCVTCDKCDEDQCDISPMECACGCHADADAARDAAMVTLLAADRAGFSRKHSPTTGRCAGLEPKRLEPVRS